MPSSALKVMEPARFLYGMARKHKLVLLEGTGRSGGKPLSLVCTDTAGIKDYVMRRAFADGVVEKSLGSVPAWLSVAKARKLAPKADMLAWYVRPALERLPRAGVLARLPAWVYVHLDLCSPGCLARGKEKFTRSGNAFKKTGFTVDVTREEGEFVDFYNRHFIPYVKSRHGENAAIQSLDETLAGLRNRGLELLVIRRGGETLAGATVEFSGETARFWQIGVRDGDPKLLAEGISDAVYHHMLTTCRERGVVTLNLGSCRPFLQDGVLEYKRRFGAYVAKPDRERRGFIDLSILRPSQAAVDFLAENPLVAKDSAGCFRLYGFARGGDDEVSALAARWRERYCFHETLGLRVFKLGDDAVKEPGVDS